MGFFSSEKKTNPDGTPITQIEKRREIGISNYPLRQRQISDSFGTTDLDYVLKAYAPEHVRKVDQIHSQLNDMYTGIYKFIKYAFTKLDKIDELEKQNKLILEKLDTMEKRAKTSSIIK